MQVKCLYGCINLQTNELVGVARYKAPKYAFTQLGWARRAFGDFIKYPRAYAIVKLVPVDLGIGVV